MPKSKGRKKRQGKTKHRPPRVYREHADTAPLDQVVDNDADEAGRWTVIGRIVGPTLPGSEVRIGNLRIIPTWMVPPTSMKRLPKHSSLNPRMTFTAGEGANQVEADSIAVSPPVTVVTSRWIFLIEVDAENSEDAHDKAQIELTAALAALNLSSDAPYVADILRLERGGTGHSGWSYVTAHIVEVAELTQRDARAANELLPHLEKTAVAKSALGLIQRALVLDRARMALPELAPSVLLAYFMAIERIANELTKGLRKDLEEDLNRETARAAQSLRDRLTNPEISTPAVVDGIAETAREFARIRFSFSDLKVEKAAQSLQLDSEHVEDARKFSKFRNNYLGHPRSDIPPEQIGYWFSDDRAFRLANAFVRTFIQAQASL